MSYASAIALGREAIFVALLVCAPALILGLVTGLVISIFQAVTQIQEPTLTFIPKIVIVGISILIFGPWMLALLTSFMLHTFQNMHNFVR